MPGATHSDQTWTLKPTSQGLCYDEKKVGKKALRAEDIRKMATALIREQNAVPFDPNAGWTTGDLIPEYVLNREGAKGSGAERR
jgi:hypothetical protein